MSNEEKPKKNISSEQKEIKRLEERAKQLASKKASLQLIIHMMEKLGTAPGIEDMIQNMLSILSDNLGGSNISLYYTQGKSINCADVFGNKCKLVELDDPYVKEVFQTAKFIEQDHDFAKTLMLTSEFSRAYTWIFPLRVGNETIGVIKMEGLHIGVMELRDELPAFFSFFSLLLKNEIQTAEIRLSAQVFEKSNEGIIITDADTNIISINKSFTAITGYSAEDVLGKNPKLVASGRHDNDFYREMWESINLVGHWQGEIWNRRKDGTLYPEWLSVSRVLDSSGHVQNYIGIFTDVTSFKEAQEHILQLAHYDALTGLPNRTLLYDRVNQAISMAERDKDTIALLFLDLDQFKHINDTLGHNIGDELLVQLAQRLKSATQQGDTVSRMGGDEFFILLPGSNADKAAIVAEKILMITSHPYNINQHELTITPSIGIALYPVDGFDFESLTRCADTAMYRAKQEGRNAFRFFTLEMQTRSTRNLRLENGLRKALERDELEIHYQPQVCLLNNQVIGMEALARWNHPEMGAISPTEFIPLAENNGLIIPLGNWVLKNALKQLKTWLDSGMEPMTVAVNISAIQFRHSNLPEIVENILAEVNLPGKFLELELTESMTMENPQNAVEIMEKLHHIGVKLSIDDFGTGYSSLSYLKRFHIDKLKIDISFIRDLCKDPEDEVIVQAIINLAQSLRFQTIAEGVETGEQLNLLRKYGCDDIQGFYFSKPLRGSEFLKWLEKRKNKVIL